MVRMVRTLRVESVRSWVGQADIDDGLTGGVTSDGVLEIRRLKQENRELKRANEILRRAASFLGAGPQELSQSAKINRNDVLGHPAETCIPDL